MPQLVPYENYQIRHRPATGAWSAAFREGSRAIRALERYRAQKRQRTSESSTYAEQATPSAPLTGRFDYKTDYKKRKLTKRRRLQVKRQKKWANKVLKTVRERAIGTTHILKRTFLPDVASPAAQSNAVCFGLYGLNGQDTDLNSTHDIGHLMYAMSNTDWNNWETNTGVISAQTARNNKIHSYQGTMEFTMINTGTSDIIAEVYFIRARRTIGEKWKSPTFIYEHGFKKQGSAQDPDVLANIGTDLVHTDLGVTPFQNSLFCRSFNIFKRQKYRIPAGDEVSFVHNDSRYRVFTLGGTKPFAMNQHYSGVLVQWSGVSVAGGVPSTAAPSLLTFTVHRRYRIKMEENDDPTDARLGS